MLEFADVCPTTLTRPVLLCPLLAAETSARPHLLVERFRHDPNVHVVDIPATILDRPVLLYSPLVAGQPSLPIEYPESDGEPMAESDVHRDQMSDALLHPLTERFRHDANVYVSGNLLLYYQEGNPYAFVAPDVFVVFGVPNQGRRTYLLWEEAKAPDIVFELTSEITRLTDLHRKRLLYEELGVREYFLFDPLHDYLRPPLQGFHLRGAYYAPVAPDPFGEDEWEMYSEVLRLTLRTDGRTLRLYDPEQECYLLTPHEEAEGRRAEARARRLAKARTAEAEARAAEEVQARRAAEAEIARLRVLMAQQND